MNCDALAERLINRLAEGVIEVEFPTQDQGKLPVESGITGFGSIQHAKPLLFVRMPESQPFMELVQGNIEAFTELFYSTDPGEIPAQDKGDEEQVIAGIGDNDISWS